MLSLIEAGRHAWEIFGNGHDVRKAESPQITPRDALDSYYEDSISKWAPGAAIRALYDATEPGRIDDKIKKGKETRDYLRFAERAKQIAASYLDDGTHEYGSNGQDGNKLTRKNAAMERLIKDIESLQSRHRARGYKFIH